MERLVGGWGELGIKNCLKAEREQPKKLYYLHEEEEGRSECNREANVGCYGGWAKKKKKKKGEAPTGECERLLDMY